MVTLSFTIFSGQKNYNRAHMLFQVLCGFEPIFYTTHPNEESQILAIIPLFFWGVGIAYVQEKTSNISCSIVTHIVIKLIATS